MNKAMHKKPLQSFSDCKWKTQIASASILLISWNSKLICNIRRCSGNIYQILPSPFMQRSLHEGKENVRMKNSARSRIQSAINPSHVSIGSSVSGGSDSVAVFTRIFRCRKKGFDYLGQVQIQKDVPKLCVEIFNENYFDHFENEKNAVMDGLETIVLRRLMRMVDLSPAYKTLIRSFLEAKTRPQAEALPAEELKGNLNGFDLQEIFDRLNAEYFDNKIQAGVGWGRDSKKKNRSAFRFGSYDRSKRLIRIHPRLNQEFVPLPVVELTIYHEMCHQWTPSVKRNGVWRDHHADFKKKEKEYRYYQEAHSWEKQNWKKFLSPIEGKTSQ